MTCAWASRTARLTMTAVAAVAMLGCAARAERANVDRAGWERQLNAEIGTIAPNVEAIDLEWDDAARHRVVPVRVYLPADEAGSARATGHQRPLVVFSHGLGGTRMGYSNLGRYWASQGFITMHLQHPGSDRGVWGQGGTLAMIGSIWAATTPDQAIARALDVRFALDRILADPRLGSRIDAQRIGIAGHSFGANTALLVAGARFQNRAALQSYGDARIKAAIILSPPSLPSEFDPVYVYNPIAIPTLHLTGTDDTTPIPGLMTSASDRRVPFDSMVARPRFLGIYAGGRHTMFNDWTRDEWSQRIKNNARALTVAFWRATLLDDPKAMQDLTDTVAAAGPLAAWEKF